MNAARLATPRTGTTLIELIVALAILTTIAAVVGLSVRGPTPQVDSKGRQVAIARRRAVLTGRPQTFVIESGHEIRRAIALPDGSVIAPSSAGIDAMSGRPANAPR